MWRALLLLLVVSVPAHAAEGFIEKHGAVTAAVVMHTLDWSQTQTISKECHSGIDRYESNPFLGRCPTRGAVNKYFILTGAILLAGHAFLPEKYSYWTDRIWLTVETGVVGYNLNASIKFSF